MAKTQYTNPLLKKRMSEEELKDKNILLLAIYNQYWDKIQYFKEEAWDEEIIKAHADDLLRFAELPDFVQCNETLIKYALDNNIKTQLLFPDNIIENGNMLNKYSKLLNIDMHTLRKDLNRFYAYNDEILDTINPLIFKDGLYLRLPERVLKRLIQHPDVQEKLVRLDGKKLEIALKLIKELDKKSGAIDDSVVFYNILTNLGTVNNATISNINPNTLTQEQINVLIIVLQDDDRIYKFNSNEKLSFSRYIEEKHKLINEQIKYVNSNTENIDIETIKDFITNSVFGMRQNEAKFLVERYCHDIEDMKKIGLPEELEHLLEVLKKVVDSQDKEELVNIFNTSIRSITARYNNFAINEAEIRTYYAKKYKEALYKVNKNEELSYQGIEGKIYRKINSLGGNIKVYAPSDEFKMQVHAIGAYNKFETPDNFKEYWDMPKAASHGLCTSLISNEQIATSRQFHPMFGFSSYADSELLLSGDTDLKSKHANLEYSISHRLRKVSKFFSPSGLIDNTRHGHNEVVIERKTHSNTKRYPDYVVLIIDDKNNPYNFQTKEETLIQLVREKLIDYDTYRIIHNSKSSMVITKLVNMGKLTNSTANKIRESVIFEETVQASHDFGIPIVIVDRLEVAKKEINKVVADKNKFKSTQDKEVLNSMFLRYFNNMIGCHHYKELQDEKEYHKIFTMKNFKELYEEVYKYIDGIKDLNKKYELLSELEKIISVEKEKNKFEILNIELRNFLEFKSIELEGKLTKLRENQKNVKDENRQILYTSNIKELEDIILYGAPISERNLIAKSSFVYVKNETSGEEVIYIDKSKTYARGVDSEELYSKYVNDIKMIIFLSGRKIRLIERTTNKILFNSKDMKNYKKQFAGIEGFSDEDYTVANNLYFPEINQFLPKIDQNVKTVQNARNPIVNNIISILNRIGLTASYGYDKNADVEIIEAGSTGRYTNLPVEDENAVWDFDFTIKVAPEKFNLVKNTLAYAIKCDYRNKNCSKFKLRFDKVQAPGSDKKVDVDLAFVLGKEEYISLDDSINRRLQNIKKQDEEKYKQVIANIMFAKKFMKKIGAYKGPRAMSPSQKLDAGLTGIGIEFWILQHGGSFIEAATAFTKAANNRTFNEFKTNYSIYGLGESHMDHSRNRFEYQDFVKSCLRENGYNRMVFHLNQYLYNYYNSPYMQNNINGKQF